MLASSISMPSKWFSKPYFKLNLPKFRPKPKSESSNITPSTPNTASQNSPNPRNYEFNEVFHYFDSNGDGKISCEELRAYFSSMGESMTHDCVEKVIKEFDSNGDKLLELQDFVRLVEGDKNEVDDDLRRAFEMFEIEKGYGFITPDGLQQTFSRLGDVKSYDECVAMIRVFDVDGNGVLDFDEFLRMMNC